MSELSAKDAKHIKSHILDIELSDGEYTPLYFPLVILTMNAINRRRAFLLSRLKMGI